MLPSEVVMEGSPSWVSGGYLASDVEVVRVTFPAKAVSDRVTWGRWGKTLLPHSRVQGKR